MRVSNWWLFIFGWTSPLNLWWLSTKRANYLFLLYRIWFRSLGFECIVLFSLMTWFMCWLLHENRGIQFIYANRFSTQITPNVSQTCKTRTWNDINIQTLYYKKQESIVHWRKNLFLESHPACLRTKLLVYLVFFFTCLYRCRWYRLPTCLLVFHERARFDEFFTPWHLFCDKSTCHSEEENIPWACMIRDMITIDISLPIPPHYRHHWKGRGKVTKIFQRAENDTGGKTMANRGVQNVILPPPSIW